MLNTVDYLESLQDDEIEPEISYSSIFVYNEESWIDSDESDGDSDLIIDSNSKMVGIKLLNLKKTDTDGSYKKRSTSSYMKALKQIGALVYYMFSGLDHLKFDQNGAIEYGDNPIWQYYRHGEVIKRFIDRSMSENIFYSLSLQKAMQMIYPKVTCLGRKNRDYAEFQSIKQGSFTEFNKVK